MARRTRNVRMALDAFVQPLLNSINASLKGLQMPDATKDWKVRCLHCYSSSNDKVYVAVIDQLGQNSYRVCGYYGKRTKGKLTMDSKDTHSSLSLAERQWRALVDEKTSSRKGYVDITSLDYQEAVPTSHRTTMAELLAKIDTTRIVGHVQFAPSQGIQTGVPVQQTMPTKIPKHQETRVKRSIHL